MVRNSASRSRLSAELHYDDIVEVRHGVVDGLHISLVARGDPRHGFLLERHRRAPGEPVSILRLDAHDPDALTAFVAHDPYAAPLDHAYRAVLDALDAQPAAVAPPMQPAYASECESDVELIALMRRVTSACGAAQCFYHWFELDELTGEPAVHHLLIGGDPTWAQRYVHGHWHLNDPSVIHARDDTRPLRGSMLRLPTAHWLSRHAAAHGMASHQFHPAHRRDVSTFGVLHVSTPNAAPVGEARLWEHRRPLRGLANELLEWQVLCRRRELAATLSLEAREILVLQLVARGGNAHHVAAELGTSERAVYQLFTAINRKLDCEHIRVSANKARQFGLLGESYISEL